MELPSQGNYATVCGARLYEVKAIEKELANCEHGQRAFQKLPRNMQRRALSSNPRRLPLYLREQHKREVGNVIKVKKRRSRKYRRRPSNLMSAYSRRQRENVWLESHIWHAKRFHMDRKWGYCLPMTPTNKSFRASIRAATETCLLQDVSYECALEIEGPYGEIVDSLKRMTANESWPSFFTVDFRLGLSWFSVVLFEPQCYPFKVLGAAQIIASNDSNFGDPQKIWVWVHPSIFEDVLSSLVSVFDLSPIDIDSKVKQGTKVNHVNSGLKEGNSESDAKMDIDVQDNASIDTSMETTTSAEGDLKLKSVLEQKRFVSKSVTLSILKDNLVKFRLIGPRSYYIIQDVLKSISVAPENDQSEDLEKGSKRPWWVDFYSDKSNFETLENQINLWTSFDQKTSQSSRQVFGYIARDPRITLPAKKKSILCVEDIPQSTGGGLDTNKLRTHPIFLEAVRKSVSCNLESTSAINKRRSDLLVPGSPLEVVKGESRIPVMLLRHPGPHVNPELGHGWDIIMPSGCGAPALVSFANNGAAIGGQNQRTVLQNEFLLPPSPQCVPDTKLGRNLLLQGSEKRNNYFKRPPNSRLNFIKLRVRFPFAVDWLELVKDWEPSALDFYVLRKKSLLDLLSKIVCHQFSRLQKGIGGVKRVSAVVDDVLIASQDATENASQESSSESEHGFTTKELYDSQISSSSSSSKKKLKNFTSQMSSLKRELRTQLSSHCLKGALLYVRIVLLGKGNLEELAMVALPTEDDFKAFSCGHSEISETAQEDPNFKEREALRNQHKQKLNIMRKNRKRAKDKIIQMKERNQTNGDLKELLKSAIEETNHRNESLVAAINGYSSQMNELWLQDKKTVPFQCCTRKVIGYLTQGGFCQRVGRPTGLGYVACHPFLRHLSQLGLIDLPDQSRVEVAGSQHLTDGWDPDLTAIKGEMTVENQQMTDGGQRMTVENQQMSVDGHKQVFVLVRNPSSLTYRWGRLVVLSSE